MKFAFPDVRWSHSYRDGNPGRDSIIQAMSSAAAERKAKELARADQNKLFNGAPGTHVGSAGSQ